MKVHLAATGILKKFPAELAKCEFILESFYSVAAWQIPFLLNAKSFLLDSGAFTFLRSGKRVDWDDYVSRYARFINEHGVKQYFELDIDKIIGFDAVLDIRRRLERETGVKPIPVWHRSRGLERFKRDASDYPYIAIGGLAIKDIKPQEYELLPYFIDEGHKRGAIVHGLGFTDTKRYKTIKFDTVDSTTWAVGGKYGCICEFDGERMTQRKTDGKRCINQNGLMLYNYNEWLEYQRYAKTHFSKGRKHHEKTKVARRRSRRREHVMKVFLAGNGLWQTPENYGDLISKYKPCRLESFYYADKYLEKMIPLYSDFLLDSGAFTFLSSRSNHCDWNDYLRRYADFINRNKIDKFFELDIDSVVGYPEVLRLRDKLENLTNRKCIPVWHKGRGYKDFLDTCEKYSYVAIGGVVIKEIKPPQYVAFKRMLADAAARKCKVHGLGFTKLTLLHKYPFYSVDSSAWTTGNRFGYAYWFDGMTLRRVDAPPGKRVADPKKLAMHNYEEWCKYADYAKTHFRKGRKHHEKNQNFNASGMAFDTFCIVLSDQQYSCGEAICLAVRRVNDGWRHDDVPDNLHPLRHLLGGLRLQMEPDNLLYGVRHESAHGGAVPDRDNFTPLALLRRAGGVRSDARKRAEDSRRVARRLCHRRLRK